MCRLSSITVTGSMMFSTRLTILYSPRSPFTTSPGRPGDVGGGLVGTFVSGLVAGTLALVVVDGTGGALGFIHTGSAGSLASTSEGNGVGFTVWLCCGWANALPAPG